MILGVRRHMLRFASYALLLLMPISQHWPMTPSPAPAVLSLYVTPGLHLSDIALVLVLLAGLFGTHPRRTPERSDITLSLLLLTGLALATAPLAVVPFIAWYSACRWVLVVCAYLVLLRSDIPMEQLVKVLVIGLSMHALIGIAQGLNGHALGIPGEKALPIDHPWAPIIETGNMVWLRAYGMTINPNVLGGFLVVGLLLSLPLLNRMLFCVLWCVLWAGLLATFSRSAWLSVALLMPVAVFWLIQQRPYLRRPLLIATGAAVCIILVGGSYLSAQIVTRFTPTLSEIELGSLTGRIELAKVAVGAIAERPVSGVGASNFPIAVLAAHRGLQADHAHNVPLQLSAELGVLGGALWLWLLVLALAMLLHSWRHLNEWTMVALCAWLALGSISLFDGYAWSLQAGRLLTITLLGLIGNTWIDKTASHTITRAYAPRLSP